MKNLMIVAGLALVLAGCGNGSGGSGASGPPSSGEGGAMDGFTTQVAEIIGGDENGEPESVEGISASSPEDTEPASIS